MFIRNTSCHEYGLLTPRPHTKTTASRLGFLTFPPPFLRRPPALLSYACEKPHPAAIPPDGALVVTCGLNSVEPSMIANPGFPGKTISKRRNYIKIANILCNEILLCKVVGQCLPIANGTIPIWKIIRKAILTARRANTLVYVYRFNARRESVLRSTAARLDAIQIIAILLTCVLHGNAILYGHAPHRYACRANKPPTRTPRCQ